MADNIRGDAMSVQIICPNLRCRKILAVTPEQRGKTVKCQHCGTILRVPGDPKPEKLQSTGPAKPS
jgi:hypothetical protein